MKKNCKKEAIYNEIKQWITDNKDQLPLNVNTLGVRVWETDKTNQHFAIHLSKYASEPSFVNPLYKPYSKMFDGSK
jgi:hypothetical protein